MNFQGFYLMPHPPIVIPEVGKGEEVKISSTSNSMDVIGKEIADMAPDTIVIITPHGTMFSDAIALAFEDPLTGSFKNFGAPQVKMEISIDKPLVNKILQLAAEEEIPVAVAINDFLRRYNISVGLDHGTMVPLYFINKYYRNYKLVHITYAPLGDIDLYRFGMAIGMAVKQLKRKAVFIASGDLSHKLKEDGPYNYHPDGEKFDAEILHHLQEGDVLAAFSIDKEIICNAGECGRRSILTMLGALEGYKFKGDLLSYEGTFGVGYGVMRLKVLSEDSSRLIELEGLRRQRQNKKHNQQDPYVRLARESLTKYIVTGEELKDIPDYVTEEMLNNRRGVFVSLKKYGELRGCIGTIAPTTESVAHEIIRNAIEAGIRKSEDYTIERFQVIRHVED